MKIITREAQGKREYMEDRFCVCNISKDVDVYGVFDGHGGSEVAEMCAVSIPLFIKQGLSESTDISQILMNSFDLADSIADRMQVPFVGSTAVVALVNKTSIWFANAGDSMAMVVYKNGICEMMSIEHKVEFEKERIQSLGGTITYDDGCARIERTLNVSRSIGDFHKKLYVTSKPFIRSISRNFKDIDYILLASDGVWDLFKMYDLKRLIDQSVSVEHGLDTIIKISATIGSDNATIQYISVAP